jgi:hypothetical protein
MWWSHFAYHMQRLDEMGDNYSQPFQCMCWQRITLESSKIITKEIVYFQILCKQQISKVLRVQVQQRQLY